MPDDFDAGVIGMKVGQTKVIGFEGPRLELDEAGKPIMEKFESVVTVKRIVGSKTATMDDEWARTVKPGIETCVRTCANAFGSATRPISCMRRRFLRATNLRNASRAR